MTEQAETKPLSNPLAVEFFNYYPEAKPPYIFPQQLQLLEAGLSEFHERITGLDDPKENSTIRKQIAKEFHVPRTILLAYEFMLNNPDRPNYPLPGISRLTKSLATFVKPEHKTYQHNELFSKVGKENKERIIKMLRQDMTVPEIYKFFDFQIPRNTIYQIARANRIDTPGQITKKLTDEQIKSIEAELSNGRSIRYVAFKTGVGEKAVRDHLKKRL